MVRGRRKQARGLRRGDLRNHKVGNPTLLRRTPPMWARMVNLDPRRKRNRPKIPRRARENRQERKPSQRVGMHQRL